MPAYLKVVDKFLADYTFCRIGGLSNGLPSPAAGSQQPDPETSVSFKSFNARLRVKWVSRTWYAYERVSKLSLSINHSQILVPNHNTNAGPATVWLQVYYIHLFCTHVLLWSVCARSAQLRAPAASHTGAGHKGHNPYNQHINLNILYYNFLFGMESI